MAEYIERSVGIARLTALEVTTPTATIADAKRVLADMTAADVVSKAVFEQVAWERDLAIHQLRKDYGVGLGEKRPNDMVEVVMCRDCKYWSDDGRCEPIENGLTEEYTDGTDFCSYGDRRADNEAD